MFKEDKRDAREMIVQINLEDFNTKKTKKKHETNKIKPKQNK